MPGMEMDMERLYALYYSAARQREAIREARAWLLDCFEDEEDQREIALLNSIRIVQSIETHYEGGYEAFLVASDNVGAPA